MVTPRSAQRRLIAERRPPATSPREARHVPLPWPAFGSSSCLQQHQPVPLANRMHTSLHLRRHRKRWREAAGSPVQGRPARPGSRGRAERGDTGHDHQRPGLAPRGHRHRLGPGHHEVVVRPALWIDVEQPGGCRARGGDVELGADGRPRCAVSNGRGRGAIVDGPPADGEEPGASVSPRRGLGSPVRRARKRAAAANRRRGARRRSVFGGRGAWVLANSNNGKLGGAPGVTLPAAKSGALAPGQRWSQITRWSRLFRRRSPCRGPHRCPARRSAPSPARRIARSASRTAAVFVPELWLRKPGRFRDTFCRRAGRGSPPPGYRHHSCPDTR